MIRSALLVMLGLLLSASVQAKGGTRDYKVTITNISKGQTFTPILVATHRYNVSFFTLGEAASPELIAIAESGMFGDMQTMLDGMSDVSDTNASGGLLFPGDEVTIDISTKSKRDHISFAGMLIPTNDTFVALDSFPLPKYYGETTVLAYDAGSELNDELCANIPGPVCGDMDGSGDAGEGYVYIGNGIHGIGDLAPTDYDWNNPVAHVVIKRVK